MKKFSTILYPVLLATALSILLVGATTAVGTPLGGDTEESTEATTESEPDVMPQSDLLPPASE